MLKQKIEYLLYSTLILLIQNYAINLSQNVLVNYKVKKLNTPVCSE